MREIKFRAWDKEENRMIYSDEKLPYDAWFSLDNGTVQCLINYAYCDSFGDEHDDWQPLDNIMPYTGLKDKNDKEIYEGDILQGHGNKNDLSKVVYGNFPVTDVETLTATDNVIGWHYEVIPTDTISKCEPFNIPMPLTDYYINRCEFEVIGNIYENPELLEVEQ